MFYKVCTRSYLNYGFVFFDNYSGNNANTLRIIQNKTLRDWCDAISILQCVEIEDVWCQRNHDINCLSILDLTILIIQIDLFINTYLYNIYIYLSPLLAIRTSIKL